MFLILMRSTEETEPTEKKSKMETTNSSSKHSCMISKTTSAPWLPDPHILSVGDTVHTMVFEDEELKLSIIG